MEACARAELWTCIPSSSQPQENQQIDVLSVSCKSIASEHKVDDDQKPKFPDPYHSLGHEEQNVSMEGSEEVYSDALSGKQSCLEQSPNELKGEEEEVSFTDYNKNMKAKITSQIPLSTIGGKKLRLPQDESNMECSIIRNRKFELPELSRLFLGDTFRIFFTITACLDLYGLTWSIAAVFASSLAAEFSIWDSEEKDYLFFIGVFALTAIPLTLIPIISQVWIQILFFIGRMIMVVVMLATCAAAYNSDISHFGDQVGRQKISSLANFNTLQM
jgi:hypothetical protein